MTDDGQKADLIDGVIHASPPDTLRNNDANTLIISLLCGYDSARRLNGTVVGFRYAFELSDTCAVEPDVAYIGAERMHLAARSAA
jgi:hypothetical protein